jgi:peptidoglycan/xylan/chitin deacetylase (PgdA/CDA1 family)
MVPYGLMFHYFHGGDHVAGQGSLSSDDLGRILDVVGTERVVSAEEWCRRAEMDALEDAVCHTFDDGLRSQYDIALPVLEQRGLTAFFFVHTSVLDDPPTGPELHRYLRSTYDDLDGFYRDFFTTVGESRYGERVAKALSGFDPTSYLTDYPFYTDADKRFRLIRDDVLDLAEFEAVVGVMLDAHNIERDDVARTLWLQPEHVQDLEQRGHIVGLHSHSHPMRLARLSYEEQLREYQTNSDVLTEILGHRPTSMSHPANSRNSTTFQVLRELGVTVGFRAVMGSDWTTLDLPREDCATILAGLK